jgi:glyoxylase-like metal-dependent hydrolase (beta-lactamase superfamily II)
VSDVSQWRTTFRVGDRTVLGMSDGTFSMNETFLNDPSVQARYADATGVAPLPIASFLLPGEQTVLIDAGVGPIEIGSLSGGALLAELAHLGVQPTDIDVIAISHLHLDHDGWLATRDAGATFPNATIHVGAGDYDLFVAQEEEGRFRMARHLREALLALFADGRIELVSDTTEIVPGLVALPTPGHTPGHLGFAVRDGGEQLFILGDAIYCPEQLTDLDVAAMHDVDPALARRTRELIAREAERHGSSVLGCHFPGLRAARVVGGEAILV